MKYINNYKLFLLKESIFNQKIVDLSLKRYELEQSNLKTGDLFTLKQMYDKYLKRFEKENIEKENIENILTIKEFAYALGFRDKDFENKTEEEIENMTYNYELDNDNTEQMKDYELYDEISKLCKYDDDLLVLYSEYSKALYNENYEKCNILKKEIENYIIDESDIDDDDDDDDDFVLSRFG
jgi:hypothetical protein